jgi:hypothetical protein
MNRLREARTVLASQYRSSRPLFSSVQNSTIGHSMVVNVPKHPRQSTLNRIETMKGSLPLHMQERPLGTIGGLRRHMCHRKHADVTESLASRSATTRKRLAIVPGAIVYLLNHRKSCSTYCNYGTVKQQLLLTSS